MVSTQHQFHSHDSPSSAHHVPSALRKDVRDVFEKEDGPTQAAFQQLSKVIGYPVSCEPQWHMLWSELESVHPDKTTFIPFIAKLTEIWAERLVRRVEDDTYEAWTEVLLEKLKALNRIKLSIQIANEARVKTTWSDRESTFIILLPKKSTFQASQAASAFAEDFETIFQSNNIPDQSRQSQIQEDDDWADVTSNADSKSLHLRTRADDPASNVPEHLPSLQTLPRPEILFQTTLPYLIHVSSGGPSKLTVSGTHEPSLRLLSEYLQRWIKTDPQDIRKIPYLRIKMQESKFGLGLFHDSFTIEPFDHHQRNAVVNVSLVLAFIQGVLGYQTVPGTGSAGYWEFQRCTPFTTA